MAATAFIKARLQPELKARVQALAARQLLSESAWLKNLVIRELRNTEGGGAWNVDAANPPASEGSQRGHQRSSNDSSGRVYVRLRRDDEQLLKARAVARGLRAATYVSALTRAHLRRVTPLPKDEFLALRRSIGELAAIGRNLNQIAKVANDGGQLPGSAREDFRAMLKVCEALRDNTKTLLKANVRSWESGYAEDV